MSAQRPVAVTFTAFAVAALAACTSFGYEPTPVCAPAGSTSLDKLKTFPDVNVVTAATHTGCLVKFQQGQTDAITGDDTVLAGLAAQDPYAKVGDPFTSEPYGIGAPAGSTDLVRYVNAVLAQTISDGSWKASYNRWPAPALGPAPTPPTPVYGR
jgi:polar amino acid transport system substrate-binding protein